MTEQLTHVWILMSHHYGEYGTSAQAFRTAEGAKQAVEDAECRDEEDPEYGLFGGHGGEWQTSEAEGFWFRETDDGFCHLTAEVLGA